MSKVIHSPQGYLSWQTKCFRQLMEGPSSILAASVSKVDRLDLQKVIWKIWCRKKHRFVQKYLTEAKRTQIDVDADVKVKRKGTNSVLRCENGNDPESNSCDSADSRSPALDVTPTSSDVAETSNTSSGGNGNKKEPSNVAETSNTNSGGSGNKKEPLDVAETSNTSSGGSGNKKQPSDVAETSNTSSGGSDNKKEPLDVAETSNTSGNKKEIKKQKLSFRLERVLKHRLDKKMKREIDAGSKVKSNTKCSKLEIPSLDQYLALDCEYMWIKRFIMKLGRCSIVDYHGNVVYDMYSRLEEFHMDHSIGYSGTFCGHMSNAVPFVVVQKTVTDLLKGKILVGHHIQNDLKLLKMDHPAQMIRDTMFNPILREKAEDMGCDRGALKLLCWCLLGRRIQTKTHCSVEDATATMDLFKLVRLEWEESLIRGNLDNSYKSGIKKLDSVSALNEVTQQLRWELPEYQYQCLSSEKTLKFVCKVLVNDEEYQSTSCSSKKEAKAATAEAFFVRHRKSGSESYMEVLELMESRGESENHPDPKLNPGAALNEVVQKLKWERPLYHYECLSESPPMFVCKVLVNDEEYQSTSCSSKKEAKAAAAEAFFVRHRKSGSESYMDVLKCIASSKKSKRHINPNTFSRRIL